MDFNINNKSWFCSLELNFSTGDVIIQLQSANDIISKSPCTKLELLAVN